MYNFAYHRPSSVAEAASALAGALWFQFVATPAQVAQASRPAGASPRETVDTMPNGVAVPADLAAADRR